MRERTLHAVNSLLQAAQEAIKAGAAQAAIDRYTSVLHIDPDCLIALQNIASLLADQKHYTASIVCARRALASDPENIYLLGNLGSLLCRAGYYKEAKQCLVACVKAQPEEFRHWHNLGLIQYSLGEPGEAVLCLERAYKLAPGEPPVVRDLALSCFASGQWVKGFKLHEARWGEIQRGIVWDMGVSLWRGEDLVGKHLLVHHEQGFGDTIQFCRLIPELRKLGVSKITLAVPWQLERLLRATGFADEVILLTDVTNREGFDYHIPIMSLPEYIDLGEFLKTPQKPYLAKSVPFGLPVIRSEGTLLAVGICWAGSANYARDRFRSMPFDMFLSIADIPGIQLYSLQVGNNATDIVKYGGSALVTDPTNLVYDFADLAALIDAMDLVISVDTAPVHLAGGMGKETLVLLSYAACWRWGAKVNKTPFYNDMTLIRQEEPGDWGGCMSQVRAYLANKLDAVPIFEEAAQ